MTSFGKVDGINVPTAGNSSSASGLKCTEADAGAGKDKIVASMKALGWPLAPPRNAPAAIEAAVTAAEAAIAAVTAAQSLHAMGPTCTTEKTSEMANEMGPLDENVQPSLDYVTSELQTEQHQWGTRATAPPRGHLSQMLPPIAEDSPLGDQSAQAFIEAHVNGIALGNGNAEAIQAGANAHVDAWIHGWAAQVSELLGYFSREIARLVERMDQAEQRMTAAIECRPQDATSNNERCKELAATFTEALKMEREARMYETAQLRSALCGASPNHIPNSNSASQLAEHLVSAAGAECDRFAKIVKDEWKEFSEGAASLRSRFSTELKEQHAWATLDIAEQHTAAVRALVAEHDVRVCEVAELQKRLREEIADIANEVTDEVIERQSRERQCAELKEALQQAALDGMLLPCAQSSQSSVMGDTRRKGLSTSERSLARRAGDEVTQARTAAATAPQGVATSDSAMQQQAQIPEDTLLERLPCHFDISDLGTSSASGQAKASFAASTTASQTGVKADHTFNSPPLNITSLASRAEAAVRGDLVDCGGIFGQSQDFLLQDFPSDRFGASFTYAPERRSANGTRGVSPERRSPTRASRLLPAPSVVLPPPSQPLP
mmetsp:Transcript_107589/g.169842  ORF Transcript_107589/g.169842 Transcript_107589/m.169842 type:complete len:608 (+) Transcript_107589:117-1940(+)